MTKFYCDGCDNQVDPNEYKDKIVLKVTFHNAPVNDQERIFCGVACLRIWAVNFK